MSVLSDLRERIRRIENRHGRHTDVLPFGLTALDAHLPGGGLATAALHEVAGAGTDATHGAAAALFVAGLAARLTGPVLWCVRRADLFAPALDHVGLSADRVMYVEAGNTAGVLTCLEEGLRHGGLGLAVGEIDRLSMTASRRLQLAAEKGGTMGIALRRWPRPVPGAGFSEGTCAQTRWRISRLPAAALPVPGVGRPRWHVELLRCRGGEPAAFTVESCDETGRLHLSADLADRQASTRGEHQRAAG